MNKLNILSDNFNFLLQENLDSKITVDSSGRLQKTDAIHKNFLFASDHYQLVQTLNDTCQQRFSDIVKNHPCPLTSDSTALAAERANLKKVIDRIEKIGSGLLDRNWRPI